MLAVILMALIGLPAIAFELLDIGEEVADKLQILLATFQVDQPVFDV